MKKILFIGAMVCMTAIAFVACKKDGGNGASGTCVCKDALSGQVYEIPVAELAKYGETCADQGEPGKSTCYVK